MKSKNRTTSSKNNPEKDKQLQDIFKNALECVARLESSGNFLSVNSNYAQVYDYQTEDMIGMSWKETVHPDDLSVFEDAYQNMLKLGRAETDVRGIKKGDTLFYKHVVLVKGLADDKSAIGHYCFIQDITERVLNQQALTDQIKLNSEKYHSLVKNIQGVVYRCHVKGWQFGYLDTGITQLLGIEPSEIPGNAKRLFLQYTHPQDRKKIKSILKNNIPDDGFYEIEYRVVCKNGKIKWLQNRATYVFDKKQGEHYIDGVLLDITDRKELELELIKNQQTHQSILTQSLDAFVMMDSSGRVTDWNPQAEKIFGWKKEEVIDQYLSELIISENLREAHQQGLQRYLETQQSSIINKLVKLNAVNRDGVTFPIELTVSSLKQNGTLKFYAFIRDITVTQRLENLQKTKRDILEMIALGKDQQIILDQICVSMEKLFSTDVKASIMIVNGDHLNVVAAPTCSKAVIAGLDGLLIGRGSCGAAAQRGEQVIVCNVHTDPLWEEFTGFAREHNISACWSTPYISSQGKLLGTFALSHEYPCSPDENDLELMQTAAFLIGIVIERQLHQIEIKEIEDRYFKAIETSPAATIMTRFNDGKILAVNKAFEEAFGYDRNEVLGKKSTLLWPELSEREKLLSIVKESGECKDYECDFKHKDGHVATALISAHTLDIDGELCLFTAGHDISERIQIENELRKSEERYADAINLNPDAIYLTRLSDGLIFDVNEAFSEQTGYSKEEVLGKSTLDLNLWYDNKDRKEFVRQLTENKRVENLEVKYRKKNGESSVVLISSVIVEINNEIAAFTIAHDISQRIEAEQRLRDSEEMFSAAVNASPDVVVITRLSDGTIKDVNNSCFKLTGYTRDELIGKTTVEMGFYDAEARKEVVNRLKKERYYSEVESTLRRKDGTDKVVLSSAGIITLKGEACVFAILHDITQRKQDELALQESQKMLSSAFETSPYAMTVSRLRDGVYLSVNPGFTKISGYSEEEIIGKSAIDYGWANKKDRIKLKKILEQQSFCSDKEYQFRTKSGQILDTLVSASIIHVDGEPCVFAITRDVTKQREDEENLLQIAKGVSAKLGEEFFDSLVEHLAQSLDMDYALIGKLDSDDLNSVSTLALYADGNHVDNISYNLKGAPCEMVVGDEHNSKLYPENVCQQFPKDKLLVDMGVEAYAGAPLINSSNEVSGIIVVMRKEKILYPERILSTLQIFAARAAAELERIQSYQELVTSENNFRRAIASSPDSISIAKISDGTILEVNEGFCEITGYAYDEVIGKPIADLWFDPKEREKVIKKLKQDGFIKNFQHSFIKKDGQLLDGSISSVIIEYQGEQCIFAVAHDITHIKNAERALSASERKFRNAFGKAPVGVALIDINGQVIQVNEIVATTLGYKEKDLIDKTIKEITFSDDVNKSIDMFNKLVAGEINSYDTEKRYQKKSGEPIWTQVNIASVKDDDNKFIFAIAHIIDITERKLSDLCLDRTNRALRVLNESNQGLTHIEEEHDLLQYICKVIIKTGGYRFCWVGYAENDKRKSIVPQAKAGHEAGYLRNGIVWSDTLKGRGPTGTSIRTGKYQICSNTKSDPAFKPWRKAALERKYHSTVALPLIIDTKPIGSLMIYSSELNVFDKEEVDLLCNLAENLAFGIQSIRLKKEKVKAEIILKNSEVKFRNIFGNAPVGIAIVNAEGVLVDANQAAMRLGGRLDESLIGKSIAEITHPDDLEKSMNHFKELWSGKIDSYKLEKRFISQDGFIVYAVLHCSLVCDEKNNPEFMVTMVEDITERKHFTDALAYSEAKFKMLYHDTPAMFFNIDNSGHILSVNDYGAKQLGYSIDELSGNKISTIVHEDDQDIANDYMKKSFTNSEKVHHCEVRKRRKNGEIIRVKESIRMVTGSDGTNSLFIVCEDITETYRLSQQLSYQASHDSLTGLINRAEFDRRLKRIMKANRSNESKHAICYLDLDQFKIINDTCGHLAGDALLRQLSEILLNKVRKRDTLARLGGDEFGVLMEHCELNHARRLAESLREAVEEFRFVWEDKKFSIGVSIGLVPIIESSGNVNDILRAADAACYAAKDAGRNRIHVYSTDDKTLAIRRGEMQWVNRINQALEEDLFVLYYQKIVSVLNKKQGQHYELLLRMRSDDGALIPPGAFLPAAERYDLSIKIDQWVVEKALNWLATHPEKLKQLHICAINLSGHSLGSDEFMENLLVYLDESGVPANKICFEITETSAIANLGSAIRFINIFRDKGCLFALDDFGSGVSSFGYLKNLPVDYLKIDGSFVKDIMNDRTDRAMVKSINDIGQIMGKKTIAEFVENDEILKELRKLGIDYAQGYGIGKPRPLYYLKKK